VRDSTFDIRDSFAYYLSGESSTTRTKAEILYIATPRYATQTTSCNA